MSPVAYAASWTSLDPAKYISDTYYVGNYSHVVFNFKRTPYIAYSYHGSSGVGMGSITLAPSPDGNYPFNFSVFPLGVRSTGGPPLTNSASGSIAIDVSDFKSSAALTVMSNLSLQLDINTWFYEEQLSERFSVSAVWSFSGYTSDGSYMGSVNTHRVDLNGELQDIPDDDTFLYQMPIEMNMNLSVFESDVTYIVPSCSVTFTVYEDDPEITIGYVKLLCDDFSVTTRRDMLLQNSLTLQAIEDQLGEVNDKLDQIIDQPESEKQEALEDGNSYVEDLTDVIPDQSAGFMSGIKKLANSMSYEGTDAALKLPSIALPAIPGVMDGYKLTDEMDIDFGSWIQKMPETLLTLVQVLLTIALVVFAFKELYKMISYALTLKSGGGD